MVPFYFKKDDFELNIFCVLMRLNTAKDVTLDEMRIEAYLPADPQSKAIMMKMGHTCEDMC